MHFVHSRELKGRIRFQNVKRGYGQEYAQHATEKGYEERLRKELLHDTIPRGSERSTNSKLPNPAMSAGQHQIRQIDGCDQQKEQHGAEERPETPADRIAHCVLQGLANGTRITFYFVCDGELAC